MTKRVRAAVALSGVWIAALLLFVIIDWLRILPGQCQFETKDLSSFIGVDRVFFYCTPFSDIPGHWWGVVALHVGKQIVDVRVWLVISSLVLPLAEIWLFAVATPAVWRWVQRG